MSSEKLSIKTIVFSYIIFFSGWSLRVVFLDLSSLNEYVSWSIGFLIHLVWWLFFAVFLIKKYGSDLKITLKEMTATKPRFKILLPFLALAIVYNLGVLLTNSDGFGTDMKIYDLVITVLTVGIFEESVFRGWFMNAIASFTTERKANLISSVLFVLIHYPSWIYHGTDMMTILSTSILMLGLSLAFGWVFRKNRSIWAVAIFHSFWDLLSFLT